MSEGLDFGALRKDRRGTNAPVSAPAGTTTVPDPVQKPIRKRNDYKKKYEQLKSSHEQLKKAYEDKLKNMNENMRAHIKTAEIAQKNFEEIAIASDKYLKELERIKDEIIMLRQQEDQQKQVIDMLTKEIEQFKFRPQHYSQIAQLLVSMRVRGNRAQKEAVMNIVGSTDIVEVRKYIFKLLEAPYNE